jgi:SulP family sulfate permease
LTVAFGGLVFAVSFATLVFDGPEAPAGALAAGASFVLFGGAATAAVVAARSSLPAIAEVQDGPSAIFAVMAAAIYGTEGIDETAKLPTLEAAIICTTVSTGVIMSLLGKYKLGNIVRLLPSPVTGGFLAGTGYVLTAGALKVLSGSSDAVGLDTFVTFVRTMIANVHDTGSIVSVIDPSSGWIERGVFVFAPGVALGLALAVGNRRVRKFWVVPAFLGGGVAAYFSALRVFLNLSPDDALTRGYLLGPFPNLDGPQRRFGFFLDSERFGFAADAIVGDAANANDANAGVFGTSFDPLLRHPDVFIDRVRWDVVLDQAPGAVAVIGLSVLGVLLITSAVEMSTERDGDANDELSAAGAANVVSGLGGGFVGYHSLSSTQIAHGMGAPASRVPGITCALAYVGALFVGPAPLAYVPKALIGGLLLFIGSSFLYEWVVEGKDRLPRSEYAVVLLIVVTVASQGYIAGVAAGVLGAAAVFVSDYSKVPVVRSRLRLGQAGGVRSSAPRARSEVEVINRRGAATYGAKLQGFLFFATAYKVLEEIKEAYDTPPGLSHVVLDFSAVVGVDGSAIAVFEKLERWARRERVVLVLSDCARPELGRVLDIALAGEAQPTFAFVDRPSSFTEKDEKRPLAPGLSLLRDAVGDGLVASDAFGIVVQTTDLDAALRFTEQSLLFAQAEEVSAARGGGGAERDPRKAVEGLLGKDSSGSIDVSDETTETGTDGFTRGDDETFDETFETFDAVCASVCETNDTSTRSQKAFRAAWTPVAFDADAVVCERGEVADRIYWIESAVVVVETGGRVTEETEETFFPKEERGTNERTSSAADDARDDETENEHSFFTEPSSDFGSEKKTRVVSPTDSEGSFATPGEADAPSDARRSERRETPTETPTDPRVDPSSLPSASATSEKAAAEMANAERASYGVSVTRDFMGAVGFYRRGGVGRVRFGRIVVREPGDGYCLSAEALEALERSHPRLAVRLHKLLAGTLANQVVSRNKLITQFIK